ncbi:MAG: DUF1800 domain-containing protein [Pseudomonadota bacterium]
MKGVAALLALGLVGCGAGGGSISTSEIPPASPPSNPVPTPSPTPVPLRPVGKLDAARFLMQATFGPILSEVESLQDETSFDAWFDSQRAKPVSLELPYLQQLKANGEEVYRNQRMDIWWHNAVRGEDQLRQRMAFALSEIFVVSDQVNPLSNDIEGVGNYYDTLARNALGNYRTLLEDITLSVQMGQYLSMFKNQKPDESKGIRADENYAREVMQLFTIGLVQLNLDGTVRKDSGGQPIPTYRQADIEGLARVFTGFGTQHLSANDADNVFLYGKPDTLLPMQSWDRFHDSGSKVIVGNTSIPAGLDPDTELDLALDALFNHPNVGPFIGRQLIQRLVTSNPSPDYVARVAARFNDNGVGVRGDLFAVVKAILTDTEARNGHLTSPQRFGKIKEPLLRATHLWRFFNAIGGNGRYDEWSPELDYAQAALRSPSVFNFFRPDYRPVGAITNAGLVCPECQITNEATITNLTNEMGSIAVRYQWSGGMGRTFYDARTILLDYRPWEPRVLDANLPAFVDDLSTVLVGGRMSADYKNALITYVKTTPATEGGTRLFDMVYIISSSAQFALQQ